MKRILWLLLPLCILLTACAPAPAMTEGGMEWNRSAWQSVGPKVGVEKTVGDLIYSESNDDWENQGLFYAAWTTEEQRTYYNEAGEESALYPAAAFIMVQETDPENDRGITAQSVTDDWLKAASEYYVMGEPSAETVSGQEFILRPFTTKEGSPYDHGVYALAVHGDFSIGVELMCLPDCYPDAEALMGRFLRAIHYRALD